MLEKTKSIQLDVEENSQNSKDQNLQIDGLQSWFKKLCKNRKPKTTIPYKQMTEQFIFVDVHMRLYYRNLFNEARKSVEKNSIGNLIIKGFIYMFGLKMENSLYVALW